MTRDLEIIGSDQRGAGWAKRGERGGTCTKDPWTREWVRVCLWEQGLDRAGESNSGKNGDNCI